MAITRKDGTIYRLRSPNPLGITQVDWNEMELEQVNFDWDSVTIPDDGEFVPLESDYSMVVDTVETLPQTTKEVNTKPIVTPDPVVEKKPDPVVEKKPESEPKPESIRKHLTNVVHMHCLPIESTDHFDSLYNDSFSRQQYGEKFIFESVLVEMGDLAMAFWTDTDKVTEGSIVYPFRRQVGNGKFEGLKQYRWWKVSDVENKSSGQLFRAIVTDVHPDFS